MNSIHLGDIAHSCTELRLPWPPSVNSYWQPVRGMRGMALTKRARIYRNDVATVVLAKLGRPEPFDAPVRIDVELRAPDARKRDLDNHLKGLFDALTHAGVWRDDSLVDEMTVRRGRITAGGCANVIISNLEPENA